MDVYLFYGILFVLFIGFLIQGQRASRRGRADLSPRPGYESQLAGVGVFVLMIALFELLTGPWLEGIDGWTNVSWLLMELLAFWLAALAGWQIERYVSRRTQAE